MNVLAVSLPMPPSSNNMFATFNGRRIISREYKAWRAGVKTVINAAWLQQGKPKFEPHLSLTIHLGLNYRGDISNRIKAIEDALGNSIPGFPDDRYIDKIDIERTPGIDGARILIQQSVKPVADDAHQIGEILRPIVLDIVEKVANQ